MDAFERFLVPKSTGMEGLLKALVEVFSSLAAHAEANGAGGAKVCRVAGFWVVGAQVQEGGDGWKAFYARWDEAGRIMEHVFLAGVRCVSVHFDISFAFS